MTKITIEIRTPTEKEEYDYLNRILNSFIKELQISGFKVESYTEPKYNG